MRARFLAAITATAAASLALATPSVAQDANPELAPSASSHGAEDSLARMTDELRDPDRQDAVAGMMEAMGEMMLALPVGKLMAAMPAGDDNRDPVDPDATLRDLAGADAERLPAELADRTPQMMGTMAGMADGMAALLPALAEMAERMRSELPADMR